MANRLQHLRRLALAAGAFVLGTTGCALPNGVSGGDPILGNFNRPIAPTPPPERGGLGLDSPAYDAGARIGVKAPDIPAPAENTSGGMSLPQLTSPSLLSGARLPVAGGTDEPYIAERPTGPAGARLLMPQDVPNRCRPELGQTNPEAMTGRIRESQNSVPGGLGFVLPEPAPVRPAGCETLNDPAKIKTMEDAQVLFRAAGASGQKVEQLAGGEWVFDCTVGIKTYQACGSSPLEAMKFVLEQIQKDHR
jgi:hypothetical protein